jgi:photosystem II stability/assembly factor-like uncharacterized protein
MTTMIRAALLAVALLTLASAWHPRLEAQTRSRRSEAAAPVAATPSPVSSIQLATLKARGIGPALMGGRVSDFALHPTDPFTFYVAQATGGVWKTTDNGDTFSPIFDSQPVASIGAVAVSPSAPNVVWVGTGEANDRNSSGWGNGVYRSTDGGGKWTHVGLPTSKAIARIAPHPADSNTAYVAAVGDLWSPGGERGLYKTTDGGATWKLVLSAAAPHDKDVGAGDVVIDPSTPNTVYAALYARRRTPWSFVAGVELTHQDVGGIFRSTDGGATWSKLTNGLPAQTQRIGLAIYPKNPRILYAEIQSDAAGTQNIDDNKSRSGGVFRTEDGGNTWLRVNPLNPRPFYFSQIRVDPENDKRIYVLGYALHVSEDGGATFREDRFKNVHPDLHAMAIDPRAPARILLGTDGGVYQTFTRAGAWRHLNSIPVGQFYRINVDQRTPFRICGGLQDNLNWVGPSMVPSKDGIRNSDWINIGGGDGFYCVFDPDQPDLVYTESQGGSAHRMDLRSGQVKGLRPEPAEGQSAFRFHWNSPLIGSRHQRGTMYLAGNRVFKLTEKGEKWRAISPDLSTGDLARMITTGSGAETFGVVYALAESPLKAGMLWAGTDDGKLWLTEDDGGTWTDLTTNLPAPAKSQWINRLEPSGHDANGAYLAVTAFRSGNYAPLAYRTADKGRTWQSIAGDLPGDGPVRVVREDPKNPNLLYAGTEFALWVSVDQGKHWIKLGGLPTVMVDDILIHPRDNDMVIATHGRSLYIIDDLRSLQELTPEVMGKAANLFEPRPAHGFYPFEGWADWEGTGLFRGSNPPIGATLTYWVKDPMPDGVSFAITDSAGTPVANLKGQGFPGLNRVVWDLKPTSDLLIPYGGEGQKFVRPGTYTVTFTAGDVSQKYTLKVSHADGIETR